MEFLGRCVSWVLAALSKAKYQIPDLCTRSILLSPFQYLRRRNRQPEALNFKPDILQPTPQSLILPYIIPRGRPTPREKGLDFGPYTDARIEKIRWHPLYDFLEAGLRPPGVILGLYWDVMQNKLETGNYHSIIGYILGVMVHF